MTIAVKAKAAKLVAAFEQRLDKDKCELVSCLATVRNGNVPAGFEIVRYIAHRLVGSARLFGCDDLGSPARNVESLVESGADVSLIIQAVNELVERIDRSLADGLQQPDWIDTRTD